MRYLIGLIVVALGAVLIIKTEWALAMFGRVDWAEQHLGTEGGTRIFFKLIGILLILGAFMALTGILESIFSGIFGGTARVLNSGSGI